MSRTKADADPNELLAEAREEVARIEERILSGATDVDAADLLAAEAEVARLAEVVERTAALAAERERREAEAHRVRRFAELYELITTGFGVEDAAILDALDDATAALRVLAERVFTHNAGFRAVVAELVDLGPAPWSTEAAHNLLRAGGRQIHLPEVDVFLTERDAVKLCAEAAWAAMVEVATEPVDHHAAAEMGKLAGVHQASEAERDRYNLEQTALVPYSAALRYEAAVVAERTGSQA